MILAVRIVTAALAFVGAIVVVGWLHERGVNEYSAGGRLLFVLVSLVAVVAIMWSVVR